MVALTTNPKVVIALAFFGCSALVGISWLLIVQLSRLITLFEKSQGQPRPATIQKVKITPPLIDAPPRSVSSVTEHTTRNFDPASYKQAE
jgi:hypothetical protein